MYAYTFFVKIKIWTCVLFLNDSPTFTKFSIYELAIGANSVDQFFLPWAPAKL